MILDAVQEYYDENINQINLKKFSPSSIKRLVRRR
jgi:hypothetical protein